MLSLWGRRPKPFSIHKKYSTIRMLFQEKTTEFQRKNSGFPAPTGRKGKPPPGENPGGGSACRKSLFAPLSQFSELYKVLKTIDFNGAGHPSWVSRAHPSLPPRKTHHFIDSLSRLRGKTPEAAVILGISERKAEISSTFCRWPLRFPDQRDSRRWSSGAAGWFPRSGGRS